MNTGDLIFQLISMLIPVAFILLIVVFVKLNREKNEQLRRIEEKLDNIQRRDQL